MPLNRRRISKWLRRQVWEKTGGFCYYCKRKLLPIGTGDGQPNAFTIEHETPLSKGGTDSYFNLFPCCAQCNNERSVGAISHEEYCDETPLTHNPFGVLEALKEPRLEGE